MSAQATPSQNRASTPESAAPGLLRPVLTSLLLFAVAFALRALPWASVLSADGARFVGTDAYYHARRVLYTLLRFPETLAFDRYINHPDGARAIWPPLFDAAVATLLRPLVDGSDSTALDRLLVWIPPLLGAATVVATYLFTRRHLGEACAVLAAAILCVLSGHFWYSQVGFLDHHAAVALASVALMSVTTRAVVDLDAAAAGSRLVLDACLCGLGFAVCLLLWPGMLLHLSLAWLGVLLFVVGVSDAQRAARAADTFAVAGVVALALLLVLGGDPDWAQFGRYSPVVSSRFQPWLLAIFAASCATLGVVWRSGAGRGGGTRLGQAMGVGVLFVALSVGFVPELAEQAVDAWRWLGKQEHFQSTVAESRALFDVGGEFGVRIAETRLSRFVYLAPFALAGFAAVAWRRDGSPALRVMVPWMLGLGIVTLFQKRFFNSFSIPLAILFAWSLVQCFRVIAARATSDLQRTASAIALALVAAWLLSPVRAAYEDAWNDQWRVLRGEAPLARAAGPDLRALIATADWLRANTPPTRGFADDEVPEYGVLALWGNGHVIEYRGRRPTVTNSFGDDIGEANFGRALAYYVSEDEASASAILDELNARYVLAEPLFQGRMASRTRRHMATRLFDGDGNGLSRHRLLFEAVSPESRGRGAADRIKVFEHVQGAVVVGRADPGVRVRASLGYATNRGRRGVHHVHGEASESGEYRLRLPHSTRGGPPAILTDDAYELSVDGETVASIAIDEAAVMQGLTLNGPDLTRRAAEGDAP